MHLYFHNLPAEVSLVLKMAILLNLIDKVLKQELHFGSRFPDLFGC